LGEVENHSIGMLMGDLHRLEGFDEAFARIVETLRLAQRQLLSDRCLMRLRMLASWFLLLLGGS